MPSTRPSGLLTRDREAISDSFRSQRQAIAITTTSTTIPPENKPRTNAKQNFTTKFQPRSKIPVLQPFFLTKVIPQFFSKYSGSSATVSFKEILHMHQYSMIQRFFDKVSAKSFYL